MAVQQNRKSRSSRDMRRSHDGITINQVSIHKESGDKHIRHHMTANGQYRGRSLFKVSESDE